MRLFIWQLLACQDLMQRDVTSRAATPGFRGPPASVQALRPELQGLTGIDGQVVYLDQIRLNPTLAHQCSSMNLLTLIYLKLSLKLI